MNYNAIGCGLIGLTFGFAAGFFVEYCLVNKKTEEDAAKVENDIREKRHAECANRRSDKDTEEASPEEEKEEPEVKEENVNEKNPGRELPRKKGNLNKYHDILNKTKYAGKEIPAPKTITSDEFYADQDYEKEYLLYFATNGIVADMDDHVYSLELFGGNLVFGSGEEEDVLYVRNERKKTDYQIVRSDEDRSDLTNARDENDIFDDDSE